jgi:hypothetical protein
MPKHASDGGFTRICDAEKREGREPIAAVKEEFGERPFRAVGFLGVVDPDNDPDRSGQSLMVAASNIRHPSSTAATALSRPGARAGVPGFRAAPAPYGGGFRAA